MENYLTKSKAGGLHLSSARTVPFVCKVLVLVAVSCEKDVTVQLTPACPAVWEWVLASRLVTLG